MKKREDSCITFNNKIDRIAEILGHKLLGISFRSRRINKKRKEKIVITNEKIDIK
jgi:hypothetical protein